MVPARRCFSRGDMGPQRQAVGSCPLSFWPSFPQRRPPGPWCVLHCSRRLCQPSRDPSPDPALKLHPCTHDNSGGCPIVVLVVKNPPANAGDIRDTGCPLMPCCNTYHLTRVSLTLGMGYLFMAVPAKRSHCSLPWTRGISSLLPFLTVNVG